MKTSDLYLSVLDITEDEYNYKGQFLLNAPGKSKGYDINDLDSDEKLLELKKFFELEEPTDQIRNIIMEMIMEKAHVSSSIIEGENYNESVKSIHVDRLANSLDMS